MANSALNPLIYAWKNRTFRRALIRLLKCQSPDQPGDETDGVYTVAARNKKRDSTQSQAQLTRRIELQAMSNGGVTPQNNTPNVKNNGDLRTLPQICSPTNKTEDICHTKEIPQNEIPPKNNTEKLDISHHVLNFPTNLETGENITASEVEKLGEDSPIIPTSLQIQNDNIVEYNVENINKNSTIQNYCIKDKRTIFVHEDNPKVCSEEGNCQLLKDRRTQHNADEVNPLSTNLEMNKVLDSLEKNSDNLNLSAMNTDEEVLTKYGRNFENALSPLYLVCDSCEDRRHYKISKCSRCKYTVTIDDKKNLNFINNTTC